MKLWKQKLREFQARNRYIRDNNIQTFSDKLMEKYFLLEPKGLSYENKATALFIGIITAPVMVPIHLALIPLNIAYNLLQDIWYGYE